jgi:RNA polymerase sigma factor (sigma-70 family)
MNEALSAQQRLLAESAVPTVRRMARVMARGAVSKDDLESVGLEAAVKAALHFRPELGVPFLGYAVKTIRGRMLDAACGAGRLTGEGRRGRALLAAARAAAADVRLDASPTEDDDDGALALHEVVAAELGAQVIDLLLGGARAQSPEELFVLAESQARALEALRAALASLEPAERSFVDGYYFEGHTMDVLAERLELPLIAIRRMRKRVLLLLWKRLRAQGIEEAPQAR